MEEKRGSRDVVPTLGGGIGRLSLEKEEKKEDDARDHEDFKS